jgi:hypothetical protein
MRETLAVMTGVTAIARPVQESHALCITMLKTRLGTKTWRCEQATGKGLQRSYLALDALSDQDTLLSIGLTSYEDGANHCDFSDDCATRIASSLVHFCRKMLFEEIVFNLAYSADLPNRFVSLVDVDPEVRRVGAAWVWKTFEQVSECEQAGLTDAWLEDYCRNLLWPLNTWVREVCLAVGECNGEALPTDVATEVEHFSMGHTTTKSNEDFFNKARKLQKLSSTGKVGGAALWHCSLTSPIMAESDMACAQPSAEDRVEGKANAQQGLDSDSFDARHVSELSRRRQGGRVQEGRCLAQAEHGTVLAATVCFAMLAGVQP